MTRVFKRFLSDQKGQALPIVLCVLAIGGLTVAGSLNYATTNVNGSRITLDSLQGAYAAEAGIENAVWSLLHGTSPPTQLADSVNRMSVDIQTENEEEVYTFYFGELIEAEEHFDFIDVEGDIVWDSGAGAYRYTITVTSQHTSTIKINEVGARLPVGFSYQAGSAAGFPENMSTNEPQVSTDSNGAFLLRWVLSNPLPEVTPSNPVVTQTFYITGTGTLEGQYAWAVANRSDIGAVGEISGYRYIITAKALRPGDNRATGRIKADVIVTEDKAYIVSWSI